MTEHVTLCCTWYRSALTTGLHEQVKVKVTRHKNIAGLCYGTLVSVALFCGFIVKCLLA